MAMLNGRCPSCGATTVHRSGGGVEPTHPYVSRGGLRASTMDYVCVTCGYVEKHIVSGRVLGAVAKKWIRVDPHDQAPPRGQAGPGTGVDLGEYGAKPDDQPV
jgi:predicted RNA-binding Zn-ribbon protein involved in translation (DUF1610 family)